MNDVQLILLGKGMLARTKPVGAIAWRGMDKPASPVYNAAQVAENRRLYPHLFRGDR